MESIDKYRSTSVNPHTGRPDIVILSEYAYRS